MKDNLFIYSIIGLTVCFFISIGGQWISSWDLYVIGASGMTACLAGMVLALFIDDKPKESVDGGENGIK